MAADDMHDAIFAKEIISNKIKIGDQSTSPTITLISTESNGTSAANMSGSGLLAPSGVTTPEISKWLRIAVSGVDYYIPMWT